jgi:hypothetical protein
MLCPYSTAVCSTQLKTAGTTADLASHTASAILQGG